MSTQLKIRRGTRTQTNTFTGAEGEVTMDTTNDRLVAHDGSRAGGFPHVNFKDAINNTFIAATGTLSTGVYAVTLDTAPTAYATGMEIIMIPSANNLGACDVNVNALGAKDIKKHDGAGNFLELAADEIRSGIPIRLTYDGTRFLAAIAGFNQIVVNGATGTTNTGDVNITGEFKINGAAIGGDVELVSTQDASGASSIAWTSLASGYSYFAELTGVYFSSASPEIEYSINNGVGYNAVNTPQGQYIGNGTTWTQTTNARYIPTQASNNSSTYCAHAIIDFGNLAAATYKQPLVTFRGNSGGNPDKGWWSAYFPTTSAVDAIKFTNGGSGSFTGKFSLYRRALT